MAFEDREMENLSAALVGLMRSTFELWSSDAAGKQTDSLAIECTRARAEFEHALSTYVGARAKASSDAKASTSDADIWDQAAETSVGDAPIVVPVTEARAIFETLYINGAVALFGGNAATAAKSLKLDAGTVQEHVERLDGRRRDVAELWSTICALAQAGMEQGH
jgi:hypothetical protein